MATRRTTVAEENEKREGKRGTTTIELTPEAMKLIDGYITQLGGMRGMKKAVMSRLVEWFAHAPPEVKAAIVGTMQKGLEQVYRDAFHRMGDDIMTRRDPQGVIYRNNERTRV